MHSIQNLSHWDFLKADWVVYWAIRVEIGRKWGKRIVVKLGLVL